VSARRASAVGLLHPGEMGAAVGAALRPGGREILWASAGRSAFTAERAQAAGLEDCGTVAELAARCEVIVSLCPPQAAAEVAGSVGDFEGIYLDANAVSPATARSIGRGFSRFVDGSVIGPPPKEPGITRLYLSGDDAGAVAELFEGSIVQAIVVSDDPGAASALKMAFAAWTKGTAALLLAIRSLAREAGVEPALLEQWAASHPQLLEQSGSAARSAARLGWRWSSEMDEIGDTFAASGLPDGFGRAAAEIYRRAPRLSEDSPDPYPDADPLGEVLAALARPGASVPDNGTDASL
jgi:3-hydroxyisobutyrate dehydrogenase-like beta-hydroxyacid dehydrogenase